MKTTLKKSVLILGACSALASPLNGEAIFMKKEPLKEDKIENVKDLSASSFNFAVFRSELPNLEVPLPSTKTIVIDETINKEISQEKYATREIKLRETIRYYNVNITWISYSYTFKEQSAVFVISYGEDEKKIGVSLKNERQIDYMIPDHEAAYRLHIRLEEMKPQENKAVIKLRREKIKPEEMNRN
ncbi:MAG: hypothetical protein N3G74_00315 [Candidatus Micrarchaeota archaeon]|nr:hypothetical protein [Candidatus Micrarchaeota archaeon]